MASYQIEQTPLWLEIKTVINSGKKPVKYNYKGMLHTEKEDIPILKIASIDIQRDYVNNIGDRMLVEFKMGLGDYVSRLYPFRANLEFSVKKILLNESAGTRDSESDIYIEKYKAVFLPDENRHVSATELEMYDTNTLNNVDIITVKLDLLNRSLEPLRIKMVSGIFRNVTQKQLIHSLMMGESNKIKIEGKPAIDGISLVEPDNTKINPHVVINSGLKLTSLPSYLQDAVHGVYTAGIGTYLQTYNKKKLWFIYPLFNTTRFDENVDKVIFYSLPAERLSGIDRTYNKDGSVTKILVTSTRKYKDNADNDHINYGVGFKMSNAGSFMKKPVELTENGPVGSRTKLNYEVASQSRKDGLNYTPVSDNPISSNPFTEYSKVLARNVARIDLVWENSDPDVIYPGMPCKYIFLIKDKPVELKGIIAGIHSYISLQGNSVMDNIHRNISMVSIITEKSTVSHDIPLSKPVGDF